MSKTMMLSKKYDPKKLEFPVLVSEKLDGVPVVISMDNSSYIIRSRTNKEIYPVQHIAKELYSFFDKKIPENYTINVVGELYNKDLPFKDISGMVRKKDSSIEADVTFNIFDFYITDDTGALILDGITKEFALRWAFLTTHLIDLGYTSVIPQIPMTTQEDLDKFISDFFETKPESEGIVIRNAKGKFDFKRSWDFQKLKAVDTHDLIVESFEEAIDKKTGKGLGMVGRINCHYNDIIIGVGPGKLTHEERKQIWGDQGTYVGIYAEVNAMPDKSYEALREPRFIRWRFDK